MPFLLLLSAVLLVAYGDLRNIITPAGYWIAWGVWSLLAWIFIFYELIRKGMDFFENFQLNAPIVLFAILLIVSFLLVSIVNSDVYSAYQGLKIAVIFVIGYAMLIIGARCTSDQFALISILIVTASAITFLLSKFYLKDFYIVLGDGREGTSAFYAGVMWKIGAFLIPFILAARMKNFIRGGVALVALICAGFLIISDGSRTAFIYSLAMTGWLFWVLIESSKIKIFLIYCGVLSGVIILVSAILIHVGALKLDLLVIDRFKEGDPVRVLMMREGIENAIRCLPFGCGFGSSVAHTDVGAMVVHNAYLEALGDIGVLGAISFTFILFFGVLDAIRTRSNFQIIVLAGICFLFMLHPFSTEMSEWGWFFLALAAGYIKSERGSNELEHQRYNCAR